MTRRRRENGDGGNALWSIQTFMIMMTDDTKKRKDMVFSKFDYDLMISTE